MRVVAPLMEQGRLPHLKAIAERGVGGPLKSHHPLISPRIWTSIATGKSPEKHGIKSWVTATGKGTNRLYYSTDRSGHALWNIASDAGLTVGVVNWLMTYPPEIVRGVLISDHAIAAEVEGKKFLAKVFSGGDEAKVEPIKSGTALGPLVYPETWRERALSERHTAGSLTTVLNPSRENSGLPNQMFLDLFSSFSERDEQIASMALEIESEIHPDLLMVLLQGIDRTSHFLWGGIEDSALYSESHRFTSAEAKAARDALYRYYEFTDAVIGLLLRHYTLEDLVVVVSDHGFEAAESELHTGGHHSKAAEDGVIFARGPRIAGGATHGMSVNDVTPLILAWFGLPVSAEMDGRVPEFLAGERLPPVATYDVTPIVRLEGQASGSDDALMEQLRALGYVSDADPERRP